MSTTTKPTKANEDMETIKSIVNPFENRKKMEDKMVGMSIVSNRSSEDQYKNSGPGKAFVSLFIGPVIFGMLAAIGGFGTPFILSMMGSGIGLLLGLVFGVIFAVVCIVALVRAVGLAAEWVLDTLWYGGNDLLELTKERVLALINDSN
ncbi:unnamed protein product [Rhizophagus irregularis]|nr:unnamed protein product [Rhizophagus irregularis]CAB5374027.1 unnamed protein product [Rhizophagus irregularis]